MLNQGCTLCYQGAKLVLFLTGKCNRSCWYCPISDERRGKDTVWANDRIVTTDADLIEEAENMSALGTGVTGGEAFLEPEKLVHYCSLLKEHFGPDHHIHLYTGTAPSREELEMIAPVVDEIRFHPPHEVWKHILDTPFMAAIENAKELGMEATIEVPSLPGLEDLRVTLPFVSQFNINELEWSETNAEAMRRRGYDLEDNYHNAVSGAACWANCLLDEEKVHFCTSSFKDSVQLRERLKHIAENTSRSFEEITEDGTVVYGHLVPTAPLPDDLEDDLFEDCGDHIECAWYLLAEFPDDFPGEKQIIERYPNGGMIVEVMPV